MTRPQPRSTLFPYTTLFRSRGAVLRAVTAPAAIVRQGARSLLHPRATAGTLASVARTVAPVRRTLSPLLQQRGLERSEEHTSELQSHVNLVCRLLLEKKK